MRKLLVFFIAAAAGLTVAAQEIKFKKLEYDFGTFQEEKGKVSYTFEFTNSGKSDLIVQDVKASCGCTTPDWTKSPVKPGKKGFVEATYNADGRPGAFSKTVTVTTNAGEQVLTIKGEVTPKSTKVEDLYPFDMNGLRLKSKNVNMENVEYPSSKTESIEMINNTKEPISIYFQGAPSYLTIKASPATLKANERGTIEVTINPQPIRDSGNINSEFTVVMNGKQVKDKKFKIAVSAKIVK